jgi:amidase
MKPVTQQSAIELARMLREGKISPTELTSEYIAQVQRLNPLLNALIDFDSDRALEHARAAERSKAPRGALFGLPMTVKASISVAGYRCEVGSLINRGNVPTEDATVVARLRAAGAIILGTTNSPEFLMAYETDNRLYDRTNNPWNLDYTPGGSSGGESAAISAGLSVGGLGSDSGGSVRIPAHFTGICSLKPTPGRIPAKGHLPECVGPFAFLGAIGPMARTVEDVAFLFEVLSGQDTFDPVSPPVAYRERSLTDAKRLRIGYFEDDGLIPVTPETRRAIQSAVRVLQEEGFDVRAFRPRVLEQARKLWWTFFVSCGAMFVRSLVDGHEADVSPILSQFLQIADTAPRLTADELLNAWAESDVIRGKLLEDMAEFPVLLCPACSIPAFRHGERHWRIEGKTVGYLDVMRYTQWFNLLAAPAVVVPVDRSAEGLPIGVQVVARPFEDELALTIASVIGREFQFAAPPIATGAQH